MVAGGRRHAVNRHVLHHAYAFVLAVVVNVRGDIAGAGDVFVVLDVVVSKVIQYPI